MSSKNEQEMPKAGHGLSREEIRRIARECKEERARELSAAFREEGFVIGDPLP